MPIAERRTLRLEHLVVQHARLVELVALGIQQHPQVINRDEGARMTIAERGTVPHKHLAEQHTRLVELALGLQQRPQITNRDEGARMAIAGEADWTWESLENVKNCEVHKAWCSEQWQQVMAGARTLGACAVLMAVFTRGIHRVVRKGPGCAPERRIS